MVGDQAVDRLPNVWDALLEAAEDDEPISRCVVCRSPNAHVWSFDHFGLLCPWCWRQEVSEPAQLRTAHLDRGRERSARVQKQHDDSRRQTMLFEHVEGAGECE